MKLTFDEFSWRNAERCKTDFKRSIGQESAIVHVLAACGEVGELAQDMKRILDKPLKGDYDGPSKEEIKALLFEAADAFTYLDLVATHFGVNFSDVLIEKFNIVSERVGSKIKLYQ